MAEIRIKKIKFKEGKIFVQFEKENKDSWDEFSLRSLDAPLESFKLVMEGLTEDVCRICEFSEECNYSNIKVIGVSFSFTNDIMGATITALKTLESTSSPLVINTPHKPSNPYSGDDTSNCLSTTTVAKLEMLSLEAERYIAGNRAQMEMKLNQ